MTLAISVCLIVRDEEPNLEPCVNSFRPFVDELVIVDTGSKDRTREIARSLGARLFDCPPTTHPHLFLRDDEETHGPGPYTHEFILADFAQARNVGWEAAAGDYLLWFDADDRVVGAEQLRAIVEEMERDRIAVGWLPYVYSRNEAGQPDCRLWRERIVRRGAGRWQGAIHETIATVGRRRDFERVVVEHHRQPKPGGVVHRNYKVLRRVLEQEAEHPSPRTLFYLGNEARAFNGAEAAGYFERYLRLSTWNEERALAFVLLGRIWEASGGYEQALRAYAAATVEDPASPDGWFGLARTAYFRERWSECVRFSEEGLRRGNPDSPLFHNPAERLGEPHLYYNLALCRLGRVEEAIRSCRIGLATMPGNELLTKNLAACEAYLEASRDPREAA